MIVKTDEGYMLTQPKHDRLMNITEQITVNIERLPCYNESQLYSYCSTLDDLDKLKSKVNENIQSEYFNNLLLSCFFNNFDLDSVLHDVHEMEEMISLSIHADLVMEWIDIIKRTLVKYNIIQEGVINFSYLGDEDLLEQSIVISGCGFYTLSHFDLIVCENKVSCILTILKGTRNG